MRIRFMLPNGRFIRIRGRFTDNHIISSRVQRYEQGEVYRIWLLAYLVIIMVYKPGVEPKYI